MKSKITIALVIIILVLVGFIFFIKIYPNMPTDPSSDETVVYTVVPGMTPTEILSDLEQMELIHSFDYGYNYLIENDYNDFYANTYALSKANTTEENIDILLNPETNIDEDDTCKIVVPEGALLLDIVDSITKCIDTTSDEVMDYISDTNNLETFINEYWFLTDEILSEDIIYPLEGYLGAATYLVYDTTTVEDIIYQMLDATKSHLADYEEAINDSSYTAHQILTMASIIEREAMHDEDRASVSSVFYNRIIDGMPLQSDITVLYALGETKEHVLYSDLEIDSPYNTYLYDGLTPGPIATPGVPSIKAALYPADENYYYFFANQDTGEVYYAETYEEHLAISEEYAWE